MNIWAYLMIVAANLFFLSFLIGYPLCHYFFGASLLKKHGNKDYARWDSVLHMANVELDLISLSSKVDDPKIKQILKTINLSKYSIIIFLVLFVVFAVLNVSAQ